MVARYVTGMLLFLCVLSIPEAHSQVSAGPKFAKADSLFFAGSWSEARNEYERLNTNENAANTLFLNRLGYCCQSMESYDRAIEYYQKAEANKPTNPIMISTIASRLSKCYAVKGNADGSLSELKKAMQAGYSNFIDLDSASAYNKIRTMDEFKKWRDTAYFRSYPCMANPHSREFDFWVGEWDVYGTGTKILQGHSLIERVSGGCLILENWTSLGSPYNGKSMNFVDSTGKWQQVWVGATETTGPNIFRNGEYKDGAMRFDFTTTDATGHLLHGRFTFFNQGPHQVRQLQETTADSGKTWQTVYDLTYIRRNAN